jgi:hypothetical protein
MLGVSTDHCNEGKAEYYPNEDNFTTEVGEYFFIRYLRHESHLESQNSLSPYHFTAKTLINLLELAGQYRPGYIANTRKEQCMPRRQLLAVYRCSRMSRPD